MISSKDRAVDALRDQLAGLRHSYEQRLAATEAAACGKESEVRGAGAGRGGARWISVALA